MKRNYTVAGFKDYEGMRLCDTAQMVVSRHMFPASRNVAKWLDDIISVEKIGTKLIVHMDYLYIVTRYGIFKEHVKRAILNEMHAILAYANQHQDQILGIVMHTDFPIRQEIYKKGMPVRAVYEDKVYDLDRIEKFATGYAWESLLNDALVSFWHDLGGASYTGVKIYLENTTKIMSVNDNLGSLEWLKEYCYAYGNLYGLCIDTEHLYASTGQGLDYVSSFIAIHTQVSLMCHVNAIPSEVSPKSKKDRHSDTTLFECSVNEFSKYKALIELLESRNIPWVREVSSETMLREIEQLEEWRQGQ